MLKTLDNEMFLTVFEKLPDRDDASRECSEEDEMRKGIINRILKATHSSDTETLSFKEIAEAFLGLPYFFNELASTDGIKVLSDSFDSYAPARLERRRLL